MKRAALPILTIAALMALAIYVLPVCGVVAPSETIAASASATAEKPYVSATVTAATVIAGTPETVSGVSVGPGNTVQIWVFAGNYVNVSTVLVNSGNTYSKTYDTTSLPAATYYVFVQNPGSDSKLGITTSGYSGTVVDANTDVVIFNFTGTGSLQGDAAAAALSTALSARSGDDIYTKTQFIITAPGTAAETTAIMPGSDRDAHGCIPSAGYTWCEAKQKCLRTWEEPCVGTAAATTTQAAAATTKSPLNLALACAAIAGIFALVILKKNQ